jgi:hypothetical protein
MVQEGPTLVTKDDETERPGGSAPLSMVEDAEPESVLMLHVRPEVAIGWL